MNPHLRPEAFARGLFAQQNVIAPPGHRPSRDAGGVTPGRGHALVAPAPPLEVREGALRRIRGLVGSQRQAAG